MAAVRRGISPPVHHRSAPQAGQLAVAAPGGAGSRHRGNAGRGTRAEKPLSLLSIALDTHIQPLFHTHSTEAHTRNHHPFPTPATHRPPRYPQIYPGIQQQLVEERIQGEMSASRRRRSSASVRLISTFSRLAFSHFVLRALRQRLRVACCSPSALPLRVHCSYPDSLSPPLVTPRNSCPEPTRGRHCTNL